LRGELAPAEFAGQSQREGADKIRAQHLPHFGVRAFHVCAFEEFAASDSVFEVLGVGFEGFKALARRQVVFIAWPLVASASCCVFCE
jgi:hypothetical protein